MQKLTSSQLNYMLCIRALAQNGTVRATDIPHSIGLSMPSVHNMLRTLEAMGLVEKHRHSVALTDVGKSTLVYYDNALAAAKALLHSIGAEGCEADAAVLATCLSDAAVEKMIQAYS